MNGSRRRRGAAALTPTEDSPEHTRHGPGRRYPSARSERRRGAPHHGRRRRGVGGGRSGSARPKPARPAVLLARLVGAERLDDRRRALRHRHGVVDHAGARLGDGARGLRALLVRAGGGHALLRRVAGRPRQPQGADRADGQRAGGGGDGAGGAAGERAPGALARLRGWGDPVGVLGDPRSGARRDHPEPRADGRAPAGERALRLVAEREQHRGAAAWRRAGRLRRPARGDDDQRGQFLDRHRRDVAGAHPLAPRGGAPGRQRLPPTRAATPATATAGSGATARSSTCC